MRRQRIASHGHRPAQRTIAVGAPDETRAATKRRARAVERVMEHGVTIGPRIARSQRRRVRASAGRSAVGERTHLVRGTTAHSSSTALATGSGDSASGAHAPCRAADPATTCRATHARRSGRSSAARRPGRTHRPSGTSGSGRAASSARSRWANRATCGERGDGQGKAKPHAVPTKSVQMTGHVRGRSTIQARRSQPDLSA